MLMRKGLRGIESSLAATALLLAILGALAASPAFAHMTRLNESQMVHGSEYVVVAVAEEARSRWNAQHTLILTDYILRVEDRLKGSAPERITLSIPGGALDGEEHDTCISTPLEKGGRYLLFLRGLDRPTWTPVTGAWQGMFREVRGADGKRYAAPGEAPLSEKAVEFERLVEAMRALIARVEAEPAPKPLRKAGRSGLPAKRYDPSAHVQKAWMTTLPVSASEPVLPPVPWKSRVEEREEASGISQDLSPVWDEFYFNEDPPSPIIFNQLPDFFDFSPLDQHQMGYWNRYAKNLYRVYTFPTDTWRYGNNVFDIAGFPDDNQMIQQFGRTWAPDEASLTFRRVVNRVIVESDIVLNPDYFWTDDRENGSAISGDLLFQHYMLHELGRAWGLRRPWANQDVWWDSALNLSPQEFHFATLYADDTAAARSAYPRIKLRDGAISSYVTEDTLDDTHAFYIPGFPQPSIVSPGQSFTWVNPIKIENTGTVKLSNPSVDIYLTPRRLDWTGSIYVGTLRYRTTIRTFPNAVSYLNVGRVTIPFNVPPGSYSLGFVLRDPRDAYQGNNAAWGVDGTEITVR
jgi:hypothetical protein